MRQTGQDVRAWTHHLEPCLVQLAARDPRWRADGANFPAAPEVAWRRFA